jgi:CheY-like chemotaxis protein
MVKILVIDDDSLMRRMIVRTLRSEHHDVIEAEDGSEGLTQFSTHGATLVITDILMPNKEGVETIRELRQAAPDLLILAISGSTATYLPMAKKLGANAVLAKPFLRPELIEAVNRLLGSASKDAGTSPSEKS